MAVTAVAFLAGMAAAMGLGGGSFLIIYLTVFAGVSQQAAQGINLVFFIPAAACAVWLHTRNRLEKRAPRHDRRHGDCDNIGKYRDEDRRGYIKKAVWSICADNGDENVV